MGVSDMMNHSQASQCDMMNTTNAVQNHGQNISLHLHQFESIETTTLNQHPKFRNHLAEPLYFNHQIPVSTTTFLPQYFLPQEVLHQSRNSYYYHKPIMIYPPYHSNNTLAYNHLSLGWVPPRNYLTQVWAPPCYPSWQSAESFQYTPHIPVMHADVRSCPKIQAPVAPFPFSLEKSPINCDSNASGSCFPSRGKRLSNQERYSIYETLLKKSMDGKLACGSVKSVASMYNVSTRSIHRIWERASSSLEGQTYVDVFRRYFKSGCKKKHVEFDKVIDIPLRQRTNIRSLANALNVSKSTIHRGIKEGKIRPNSNAMKPRLTDENKRSRVRFCLSMLETPCPCKQPTFKGMLDVIYVDEKWFYMSKESEKYYLHPNEVEPHRACQSKRFISKVMFLAAVARPHFDHMRNKEFSGKIGIFPFVFKEPAKRSSKNRVAGTLETKAIVSITKDVYRRCLIDKVLPAICEKWPRCDGIQKIYIQQDNAKPHIDSTDEEFCNAASIGDFEMHLTFQPSNSPDMNVLDLGFFNSIQSLQHQQAPRTIDELVHAVEESFNGLSPETINDVFLTLQASMIEVLKHNGGFDYKLPHLGKGRLKKLGTLPFQLQCQIDIVESASMQLQNTEISRWSEVSRWIICRDHVCVKHYIPAGQEEKNTRSNESELKD